MGRQAAQRQAGILDQQCRREIVLLPGNYHRGGALLQRLPGVDMAVKIVAVQRHKQFIAHHFAAIGAHAGKHDVVAQHLAHGG